ncbi:DUF3152 domain-containing protein [Luteipulveratus sp. YIM 133132]|uniref:DUF3152 domain-containing protein n=1 Tax=Luteipulveratus flavus TaxID=3031728 RepID=UPI0023AEDFC4|nr:DUF3152 domain-containing protein [Luteipulveratus sp. YIM 133132]MDE9367903.1 DUF3152 domain-containing protein [Luteipulveratus sp. YIM 133132]
MSDAWRSPDPGRPRGSDGDSTVFPAPGEKTVAQGLRPVVLRAGATSYAGARSLVGDLQLGEPWEVRSAGLSRRIGTRLTIPTTGRALSVAQPLAEAMRLAAAPPAEVDPSTPPHPEPTNPAGSSSYRWFDPTGGGGQHDASGHRPQESPPERQEPEPTGWPSPGVAVTRFAQLPRTTGTSTPALPDRPAVTASGASVASRVKPVGRGAVSEESHRPSASPTSERGPDPTAMAPQRDSVVADDQPTSAVPVRTARDLDPDLTSVAPSVGGATTDPPAPGVTRHGRLPTAPERAAGVQPRADRTSAAPSARSAPAAASAPEPLPDPVPISTQVTRRSTPTATSVPSLSSYSIVAPWGAFPTLGDSERAARERDGADGRSDAVRTEPARRSALGRRADSAGAPSVGSSRLGGLPSAPPEKPAAESSDPARPDPARPDPARAEAAAADAGDETDFTQIYQPRRPAPRLRPPGGHVGNDDRRAEAVASDDEAGDGGRVVDAKPWAAEPPATDEEEQRDGEALYFVPDDERDGAHTGWARGLIAGALVATVAGVGAFIALNGKPATPPNPAPSASGSRSATLPPASTGAKPGVLAAVVVPGSDTPSSTRAVTYALEVESGAGVSATDVARKVGDVLRDSRGWQGLGEIHFEQVTPDRLRAGVKPEVRIVVAGSATAARLCAPTALEGGSTCATGSTAVIDANGWQRTAATYQGDPDGFRTYLINHAIGHVLGRANAPCPSDGARALVMTPQIDDLQGCKPWPWPLAPDS